MHPLLTRSTMTMTHFIKIGIFCLFMPVLCFAARDELQLRTRFTFEKNLSEALRVNFSNELRFHKFAHQFFQHIYDPGVYYQFYPYLTIGFVPRYRVNKDDGVWVDSFEPMGDVVNRWQWRFLGFYLRNRFVYNVTDSKWIYRIKPALLFPIKKLSILVGNELFLTHFTDYDTNRFEIGIGFPAITDHISMKLTYLSEHQKDDTGWFHAANIVKTSIRFSW